MPLAQEDRRTDEHQAQIGSDECRKKIQAFQKQALSERKALLNLLAVFAEEKEQNYSIGLEAALEYAVLELPFSFWQWGGNCDDIPADDASPEVLFNYINEIVSWNFYSDTSADYFLPSFFLSIHDRTWLLRFPQSTFGRFTRCG